MRMSRSSLPFLILALVLAAAGRLQACSAAEVRNVTVAPGCYTAGSVMTVSFQVRTCAWSSAYGSIMFSGGTNPDYFDDAVYTSAGELNSPDTTGHNGFVIYSENGSRSWHNESYEVKVPASYTTGSTYIVVAVGKDWEAVQPWGNSVDDHSASGQFANCAPPATRTNTPVVATRTPTPTMTRTNLPGSPTSTRTVTPGGTFTSTRTPTPAPTVWQGLPDTERLYGLEYIPFPNVSSGGSVFNDLSFVTAVSANNTVARNTARYVITLDPDAGNSFTQPGGGSGISWPEHNGELMVETRIGPYGLSCTTGYFDSQNYLTATSLTLPSRPQNLSTTYAWVGVTVPATEQIQAVGDPRFVPYTDMLSLSVVQPYADNYNWFYKDQTNAAYQDHETEYNAFIPRATHDRYNGQPDIDVPKLFRLWREGIYKSRSIFNSLSGYSNYYMGDGGEIGGDSANKLSGGGVDMVGGPYNSSSNGRREEIIGSTVLVRSSTWDSIPFLGELWPDSSYTSDWSSTGTLAASTWGNLRNSKSSGVAYRDKQENVTQSGRYSYLQVQHRNSSDGCATFMNSTGGSDSFNHSSVSNYDEAWLDDSKVMGVDYNFAMASTFNVNRPWDINGGGNHPPEWGIAPYDVRATVAVYPVLTSTTTTQGFYAWHTNIDSDSRSSAAIRGVFNSMVGWFIVSGLAPSTDSGINFVARFSLIGCLRTFHDAGAPSVLATDGVWNGTWGTAPKIKLPTTVNAISGTSYRMEPIPLVQITAPAVGENLDGKGKIVLKWKERYARWDGKRYTEKYPCVDDDIDPPCTAFDSQNPGDPTREWHSLTGTALAFNIKYSEDGGSTWFNAMNDGGCAAGTYDASGFMNGSNLFTYSYSWDVSALAVGSKLVRVECYRTAYPNIHYAYHELQVTTNP